MYKIILSEEALFQDYLLLCSMKTDLKTKVRMLSILLYDNNTNPWRIEGITKNALEIFKNHNFKCVSRMGINRSHTYQRSKTYQYMIENVFNNSKDMWQYYFERDFTIFSTSSENLKKEVVDKNDIIKLKLENGLFKALGYGWKHGNNEISFLKGLYENKKNK